MRLNTLFVLTAAGAATLVTPTLAWAHTKVVASTPAQGTTVAKPREV